jgi:mono/diheme cytochrome c family protein
MAQIIDSKATLMIRSKASFPSCGRRRVRGGNSSDLVANGLRFGFLLAFLALLQIYQANADLPLDHAVRMQRGSEKFERDLRPLFIEHCVDCHGGEATKGALDLVTREGLLVGGSHGPVIEPFNAASSRMLKLLRHEEEPHMPHRGPQWSESDISRVADWIDDGAPYDAPLIAGKVPPVDRSIVTEQDRKWWAFQPLNKSAPPITPEAPHVWHPIDRFIVAQSMAKGLGLELSAKVPTLLRRATLGLWGIPPSPEMLDTASAGTDPMAWERWLDKLLASPLY